MCIYIFCRYQKGRKRSVVKIYLSIFILNSWRVIENEEIIHCSFHSSSSAEKVKANEDAFSPLKELGLRISKFLVSKN